MPDAAREAIAAVLRRALSPSVLEIEDDSARHAGHPGAAAGGGHYRLRIVAEAFRGKGPLERHRMVYAALGDLRARGIHALEIRALAPGEPGS